MGWEWQKGTSLAYLTIPKWKEWGVDAAFSTRSGGVSNKPYFSLNLALHVGDEDQAVLQNRKIFLAELDLKLQDCVAAEQIHGVNVEIVSETDKGLGMADRSSAIPACDAMLTKDSISLMAFYADCAPLYFFSLDTGLVGIAHAGRQGTVNGIVSSVLAEIRAAGGSPQECLAAVGPCIGPCCYEVGEDVATIFRENFNDPSILLKISSEKYKLDLVKANLALLLEEGIRPENVSIANICTACHPELFYSYRREGCTGRMAAIITKRKGVW